MADFELTAPEAARKLREYAELTAAHSRNWNAFEEICLSVIEGAMSVSPSANI